MNIFESIADRRILAAREAGLFDNLEGKGKPIPDLGTERPAGWWADRFVKQERLRVEAEEAAEAASGARYRSPLPDR